MRGIKTLLPLIFILFLSLPAADIQGMKHMEKSGFSAGDLLTDATEGKTNLSDVEYRDGVIDNFDYFINPGYPSGYIRTAETSGVDEYAL